MAIIQTGVHHEQVIQLVLTQFARWLTLQETATNLLHVGRLYVLGIK